MFDLQQPHDFVPKAVDGEVGAFYHLTVEEVMQKILTPEYKPNCAMVLLGFFVRRGIICPDTHPHYLEILVGCAPISTTRTRFLWHRALENKKLNF